MADFVNCSNTRVKGRRNKEVVNHPINLDLIASIQRSEDSDYLKQDIPLNDWAIVFVTAAGFVFYWMYPDKASRDAQYVQLSNYRMVVSSG